jgi:hypothetical protein
MILVHFHQMTRREVTAIEGLIGWGNYLLVEQKSWGTFASWVVYNEAMNTDRPELVIPRLPLSRSRAVLVKYTHTLGR